MTILGLSIGTWVTGIIEIAVVICFFRSMKKMQQNQQIIIDELEALRLELKDNKGK